jgi:hypothetical protein
MANPTKISFVYSNPEDPEAFEAAYAEQLTLCLPGRCTHHDTPRANWDIPIPDLYAEHCDAGRTKSRAQIPSPVFTNGESQRRASIPGVDPSSP